MIEFLECHLVATDHTTALCGEPIPLDKQQVFPWLPVYLYRQDVKKIAGSRYVWCTACHASPDLPLALLGEL